MAENWEDKAQQDARDALDNFADEIAEQAKAGKVSDDMLNDYSGGDAYHHESHVDESYDLKEAAEVLDQLDEWEESDSGLWQGLDMKEALSACAAYTYGNCVYDKWRDYIKTLNESFLDDLEGEGRCEAVARLYIIAVNLCGDEQYADVAVKEMHNFAVAMYRELQDADFTSALVFADWLEEHDEPPRLAADIRKAVALAENDPTDWTLERCREWLIAHGETVFPDPDPWAMDRFELADMYRKEVVNDSLPDDEESCRSIIISHIEDGDIVGLDDWREAVRDAAKV